jgi:hypothetical protein
MAYAIGNRATKRACEVTEADDTGYADGALVEAVPNRDEVHNAGELGGKGTHSAGRRSKEGVRHTNPASKTPIKNLSTTTVA